MLKKLTLLASTPICLIAANDPAISTSTEKTDSVYNANPWVKNGIHLTISGDYLYATSGASKMFQSVVSEATPDSISLYTSSKAKNIKNKWQSGYRVGLDYSFSAQGWNTAFAFTSFENNASQSFPRPAGASEIPVFAMESNFLASNALPSTIESQTGKWHFNLKELDFNIGKEFFVSKYFSINPRAGLRQLWLNQKMTTISNMPATSDNITAYQLNKLNMFGFKLGLGNNFHITKCLTLCAEGDISAVYGSNKTTYSSLASYTTAGDVHGELFYQDSHDILPIFDFGLSLKWNHNFMNDKLGLELKAGYEYHAFINGFNFVTKPSSTAVANTINASVYSSNATNSYMQGAVFSIALGF